MILVGLLPCVHAISQPTFTMPEILIYVLGCSSPFCKMMWACR